MSGLTFKIFYNNLEKYKLVNAFNYRLFVIYNKLVTESVF
jgi:hypothetical protein